MTNRIISPQDFQQLIADSDKDVFILDVRTPEEYSLVNLGGKLIPSYEILNRLDEIPHDKTIITICHHGIRSLKAVNILLAKGYDKVKSLDGGIDRYALEVDPFLKRY